MLTLIPTRHSGPDCCHVSEGFILSSLQGSVAVHRDFKTIFLWYSELRYNSELIQKNGSLIIQIFKAQAPIHWFLCIFWGFNHPLDQKCFWEFALESQWNLNNETFSFFRTVCFVLIFLNYWAQISYYVYWELRKRKSPVFVFSCHSDGNM